VQPLRTTELEWVFTAAASPRWLLLAVPVLLLAAVWLYRRQWRDIPRPRAVALPLLRALLLAVLAVLIFRPNLIFREILTWPGRVILLVDDSDSMTVPDPAWPAAEALRVARHLRPSLLPRIEHDRAAALLDAADEVAHFAPVSQTGRRADDAFWEAAGAARARLGELLERADARGLAPSLDPLFTGEAHPGNQAFFQARLALLTAARERLAKQAAEDEAAVQSGQPALTAAVAEFRRRPRLSLVEEALKSVPAEAAGHHLQTVRLHARTPESPAPSGDRTNLAAKLERILADPARSPVSGIIILSDGQDGRALPPDALTQTLSQRQIPVFAALVGWSEEPPDLAVADVRAPPFAVRGQPCRVRPSLKHSPPNREPARLVVRHGADALLEAPVNPAANVWSAPRLEFVPEASGPLRCTVALEPVPGEVVPERNNARDFAIAVRDTPVHILFLDWLPRWESRFALHALRALPYAEVNAIIGVVQDRQAIPRGVAKGAWPADDAALAMYDLVVIGDLPDGTLAPAELDALDRWVREHGGTLARLDAGGPDRPDVLAASPAGRVHPLTRALAAGLPDAPAAAAGVLIASGDAGEPFLAVESRGKGKILHVAGDRLWRLFNERNLDGHTQLYTELVRWAVQGSLGGDGKLGGDALASRVSLPLQVWAPGFPDGTPVEARSGDNTVATAALRGGRAEFANLRPGTFRFLAPGRPEVSTPDIEILDDSPELNALACRTEFLAALAAGTGAETGGLPDVARFIARIPRRQHVERNEHVFQPWDSPWTLALLATMLVAEWVWRKLEGLV